MTMISKIAVLNGPNLNRLGKREPEIYGSESLDDVISELSSFASSKNREIVSFQSNHEGELIDKIHDLSDEGVRLGIINPGGLTHTSVALRDAIAGCEIKFIEVHISNVHQRESFRHVSLTASECVAQICGLGTKGYQVALDHLLELE